MFNIYIMGVSDLLFVSYRFMPFIMVSFLIISSLFSGEISGLMTLFGLLLTSIITIGISQMPFVKNHYASNTNDYDNLKKCNLITINDSLLSYLPLSTHTFAYMFSYFIYVISKNGIVKANGGIIAFLTVLLMFDIVYNVKNCAGIYVFIPVIVGILSGIMWAVMIGKNNQMIPKSEVNSKCSVNKGMYKCKIKKNGQLIN